MKFLKGRQGRKSRIEIKARRRTSTHILEGMTWPHVRDSIRGQEAHGNSLPGREVMAARQGSNSRPGGARQLKNWKGYHGDSARIQFEARRRMITKKLERKAWPQG